MSAIQARIHAFESLGHDSPQQPVARKPPIKLYEIEEPDASADTPSQSRVNESIAPVTHGDKEMDDEAHELSVGSITSDFVKVTPPRSRPPPLPPRKGSENTSSGPSTPSVDDTSSHNSPRSSLLRGPPTPRPIPQKAKITGGIPTGSNTSSSSTLTVHPRNGRGHISATSASSFHSVSLSDHGDDGEETEHGLSGSYEAVSPHASSVFSLVEKGNSLASSPATSVSNLAPPALPPRPGSSSPRPSANVTSSTSDAMAHQINVPYAVRKLPPPLQPSTGYGRPVTNKDHKPIGKDDIPQRSSARSSLASITTGTHSPSSASFFSSHSKPSSRTTTSTTNSSFHLQTLAKKRPPPLPPAAKARYDAVFDANIKAQQESRKNNKSLRPNSMSRRAVGWRGTSMDATGSSAFEQGNSDGGSIDEEPRLSGHVVQLIWSCSKLPQTTLKAIWSECDQMRKGSVTKQAFANGMWRIDNELLSAASNRPSSTSGFRSSLRSSDMRP